MIRVLIVDDEKPARERLRRLLGEFKEIEVIGEASNGLEALTLAAELKPEALFLDIEMPRLNGLETARALGHDGPSVVFVTAYDEHALAAFEANSIDYLVKPVVAARLAVSVKKLAKRGGAIPSDNLARVGPRDRLAIRSGSKFQIVEIARISAIVAKDEYSAVVSEGREVLADESLDSLSRTLDSAKFVRVHRNALINLDFVQHLQREGDRKYDAVLSDMPKTRVSISRERLGEVMARLGLKE